MHPLIIDIAGTRLDAADRERLHAIIYDELCVGVVSADAKSAVLEMIERARGLGADAVIFGCTEIGLLITQGDLDLPAFDTTEIHARAAVEFALSR